MTSFKQFMSDMVALNDNSLLLKDDKLLKKYKKHLKNYKRIMNMNKWQEYMRMVAAQN